MKTPAQRATRIRADIKAGQNVSQTRREWLAQYDRANAAKKAARVTDAPLPRQVVSAADTASPAPQPTLTTSGSPTTSSPPPMHVPIASSPSPSATKSPVSSPAPVAATSSVSKPSTPGAVGSPSTSTTPTVSPPAYVAVFGKPGPIGKMLAEGYKKGLTEWNAENVKAGRPGLPMAEMAIGVGALSLAFLVEKYGIATFGDDAVAAVNAVVPVAWCWWNGDRKKPDEKPAQLPLKLVPDEKPKPTTDDDGGWT